MSMAFAQELVSSWMKPSFKNSTSLPKHDTDKELQEYMRKPPRLGVGAPIPESSGITGRDSMRLKGQLTGGKGKKRSREEEGPKAEVPSDDEEDSRAGAIRKKTKVDVFSGRGKKGKKHKGERLTSLPTPLPTPTPAPKHLVHGEHSGRDNLAAYAKTIVGDEDATSSTTLELPSEPHVHSPTSEKKKRRKRTHGAAGVAPDVSQRQLHDPNHDSGSASPKIHTPHLPDATSSSPPPTYGILSGPSHILPPSPSKGTPTLSSSSIPADPLTGLPILNLNGPPAINGHVVDGSPKKKRKRKKKKKLSAANPVGTTGSDVES
ncbi:hypothetical protein JAAARDRAFT_43411 [Jaapia argillacea MUCL 33604]|uniref:Uncharacterized protein n=1 Tax=Jaapia argillacea MUCL 33604 TaxID=933084 RepID=A0A067QB66_9AGAM|nr:hypothetical protein JAAARDRAFT_43411 [Jaapia argillacea MUCL 33604]